MGVLVASPCMAHASPRPKYASARFGSSSTTRLKSSINDSIFPSFLNASADEVAFGQFGVNADRPVEVGDGPVEIASLFVGAGARPP